MKPIFDLHCHPTLKVWLCDAQFTIKHPAGITNSDFDGKVMHVDLPGMRDGGVQCIVSFQYVPEVGISKLPMANKAVKFLRLLRSRIPGKLQQDIDGSSCFDQAMAGIKAMNDQIDAAASAYQNDPATGFNVTVPKNSAEFEAALAAGKTIVLHGLEGSHQLGRNLGNTQAYLDHLQQFKDAGGCVLTLAHFFINDITGSGGGIPPKEARLLGYDRDPQITGLTAIGEAVVNWCQDNGIIIDLVHSPVVTRNRVYDLLDQRIAAGKKVRPIVFSHTGIRGVASQFMTDPHDLDILPDYTEITKIASYDGVFGMILMNYWQNGDETQGPILDTDPGIDLVINTMKVISTASRLNSVDNICIGTDLDGFTTIPSDMRRVADIDKLRQKIIAAFPNNDDADKICSGNMLRVLRKNYNP